MSDLIINLPAIPQEKQKQKRKVLRVKTGEFLLAIYPDRIETTAHIKHALDISDIPFDVLDNVTHNLYNAGYRDIKVMEVK